MLLGMVFYLLTGAHPSFDILVAIHKDFEIVALIRGKTRV